MYFSQKLIRYYQLNLLFKRYSLKDFVELFLRLWIAYTLIKNSTVGFLIPLEDLGLPQHAYVILKGMWDTGFLMHIVKSIELVAGILFLFNRFMPLAIILLFPIVVNIYGIHIFLFGSFVTSGLYMLLICLYFGYQNRDVFKPLLRFK